MPAHNEVEAQTRPKTGSTFQSERKRERERERGKERERERKSEKNTQPSAA